MPIHQKYRKSNRDRFGRTVGSLLVTLAVVVVSVAWGSENEPRVLASEWSATDEATSAAVAIALGSQTLTGRLDAEAATRAPAPTAHASEAPADLIVPTQSALATHPPLATAEPSDAPSDSSEESMPGAPAGVPAENTAEPVQTPPGSPATGVSGSVAASDPRVGDDYILVSRSRLVSLPTYGPAWDQLKSVADGNAGSPDLSNMDQDNNVKVLAQSLVFARTGEPKYRTAVHASLTAAVGTEGESTLPLGREAAAYVLAADFIGLSELDPAFDSNTFRPWLRSLLTLSLDGRTLQSTHEERANNWGTHAGATRAAIAAYLGDGVQLARTATVFQGWLGDRSAYAGFSFGDLSWQPDPAEPVAVLPVGATLGGVPVDGALPEEMRRGGEFVWPPAVTDYPWGALEGAVLQAEILHRSGYDAYNWSDRAVLRAVRFLFDVAQWRPSGNDQWVFWVIDYRYGTAYRSAAPVSPGKNFGWSDWLFGPAG